MQQPVPASSLTLSVSLGPGCHGSPRGQPGESPPPPKHDSPPPVAGSHSYKIRNTVGMQWKQQIRQHYWKKSSGFQMYSLQEIKTLNN